MPTTWPRRPDRLAWCALSGLAAVAAVLTAAAWVALRAANWGEVPQRLLNACLLATESTLRGSWAWATAHPFTAATLGVVVGSLGWALSRLAVSIWNGWQAGRRLSRYDPGRFPMLDRAIRLAPEVDPARVRVVPSARPAAFTAGLVRPRICLSVGLIESLTDTELGSVLRHEHAHVSARDPLRLAAVWVLSDFLWFLPISRVLADAFSGQTELRADGAAVAAGSDPVELASAIVKTAKGALPASTLAPALRGLGLVERRVTRLLGGDRPVGGQVHWGRGVASGLVVAALLALLVGPALASRHAVASAPDEPTAHMRWMMSQGMTDCPMTQCVTHGSDV